MNGWIKRSASKVKHLVCLGGTLASVLLTNAATVSAEEIYRPTAAIPMPNGLALANFDIVWADSHEVAPGFKEHKGHLNYIAVGFCTPLFELLKSSNKRLGVLSQKTHLRKLRV